VASIPIPGGRSLRPVKKGKSFDKVVDQNSPYFLFPPYFSICTFNKKTPLYFTSHILTGQSTPLTKLSP